MATIVGSEFDHVDFTKNDISVRHPFKDPGGRELIRELQTALNEKESVIFNELDRSAVVSFEDGANNMPLKKLTVWMDPKQDLNGQSKPWFPGGGTNRLPFPYVDTDKTVNGVKFTVTNGGKINISGTSTADAEFVLQNAFTLPAGEYIVYNAGIFASMSKYAYRLTVGSGTPVWITSSNYTLTLSEEATISFVLVVFSGNTNLSTFFNPMIRRSDASSVWRPYANVCPVQVYDEPSVKVVNTGKNQLPRSASTVTRGGVTFTVGNDGGITLNGTAGSSCYIRLYSGNENIPLKDVQYWLKGCGSRPGDRFSMSSQIMVRLPGQSDVIGYSINSVGESTGNVSIIAGGHLSSFPEGTQFVSWSLTLDVNSGVAFDNETIYPMLVLDSDASDTYEPYVGGVHTIQLPGNTVDNYGGNLVINQDGSGVLTIDRVLGTIGNVTAFSAGDPYAKAVVGAYGVVDESLSQISNGLVWAEGKNSNDLEDGEFKVVNAYSYQFAMCYFRLPGHDEIATAEEYNQKLLDLYNEGNTLQVVYGLSSPRTYQFTAGQIMTLFGANILRSDTGPMSLTYPMSLLANLDRKLEDKADVTDTVLKTTLSRGRKEGTTVGSGSFAFGSNVEASSSSSVAFGTDTAATSPNAIACGRETKASGYISAAFGLGTIAKNADQLVFGKYNAEDPAQFGPSVTGTYVEIVGNGMSSFRRSNARTLDWRGNEKLAGSLTLGMGTENEVTITAEQLQALLALLEA